jgi:hypothetical protein
MKKFLAIIAVLALAASLAAQSKPEAKQDAKAIPPLTGKWTMTLEMSMGTGTPTLQLKQDGEKIIGSYTGRYGTAPLEGTLKGKNIEFTVTMTAEDQTVSMGFSGEVDPDGLTMKGKAVLGELGDATWSAKKEKS